MRNKIDLPSRISPDSLADLSPIISLSLRTGEGLPELKAALVRQLGTENEATVQPAVAERHSAELATTAEALHKGGELLTGDDSRLVLAAGEFRRAADALGRIIGKSCSKDLLDSIFSRFCLGK